MEVFKQIKIRQYLLLYCKGVIPKALLSMCVLVVKQEKDGKPACAKSCIVVLGNFENRYYKKLQKYAPVLCHSYLHTSLYQKLSRTSTSSNRVITRTLSARQPSRKTNA